MASEHPSGARIPSKPKRPRAPSSTVQPSLPIDPPLLNDGLELLRDTNT